MQIVFDPDFDLGAWPGPSPSPGAAAGAAWIGPEGFLSVLETRLGLAAPHASVADRAAALVPRLFREDRFFGASARADPWSTARRLLEWRDDLWEHGWRGESRGETRLGQLAEVTLNLPPGRPERLELVAGWLDSRAIDIDEVRILVEPGATNGHSLAWKRVLAALERRGTRVLKDTLSHAQTTGNLAAVRTQNASIDPSDTTLQLVRTHGPRAAARHVAEALAADPGFGETLFIAPDAILDEALVEMGLPTLGARSNYVADATAEILRITLDLAWNPVDPKLALEWLTMPECPIPRAIATRLAESLTTWLAVGNPRWQEVVDSLEPSLDRDDIRESLRVFFTPVAERNGALRVRDLIPKLDRLEQWALRSAAMSPAHAEIAAQARSLRARFNIAELRRLTPPKLEAVVTSVISDAAARRPALAGYTAVGLPGGVAGRARRVVWWNFLDPGSPRRFRVALRPSERRALASIGIELPALGDEVRAMDARARRPLLQTIESLILVAPHHNEIGEPAHPHPLWDEIVGALRDPRDARHLIVEAPRLAQRPRRASIWVARPEASKRLIIASAPVRQRAFESPTSLAKLIGCSFAHALNYIGQVRSRSTWRVDADKRLFGLLAHEVLSRVARAGKLAEGDARRAALDALDQILPTHAAILLLHNHKHDLVILREVTSGAAAFLEQVMRAEGLRVHAAEREIKAVFQGRALSGTPDIVLEGADQRLVLLDFKWSGEVSHRDALRDGTSLQLAAYAAMLRSLGFDVRALGYLILRSQRLLVRGDSLAFAQCLSPDLLDATWAAAESAWIQRIAELSMGHVRADGIAAPDHEPIREAVVEQGRLALPAPCGGCAFDLLCGRSARVP